jgi:hypothetical protein
MRGICYSDSLVGDLLWQKAKLDICAHRCGICVLMCVDQITCRREIGVL